MTLKAWGRFHVSSALDVYRLLQTPPYQHPARHHWDELLTLEAPFWGSLMDHAPSVAYLVTRGYRVWSWDDHGVVLSSRELEPPHGVHYRGWNFFFHEAEDDPTQPNPSLPITLLDRPHENVGEAVTPPAAHARAAGRRS